MKEQQTKERVGLICLVIGGLFILAGLVFFVVNNRMNLYAKKVGATVLSSMSITTSDNKEMSMLELFYKVGGENITTTYNYNGVLQEGEVFLELYYDARDPKRIIEAGWSFEPLFMALLGVIVFLLGLYYKGITDFGIVEMKKPDANAPERVKRTYEAREKVGNSIFPMLGGLVFVAFGLVMILTRRNYWMWIFVGIGALVILYFTMLLVPALIELHQLKVAKKFKGVVVNTQDTTLSEDAEGKDSEDTKSAENEEAEDLKGGPSIKDDQTT